MVGALLFLVPFLVFVRVELVTTLYASTALILLLTPPVLLASRTAVIPRSVRVFAIFCLLWLVALVVSDLTGGSPWNSALRGWTRASVTLITTVTLALLIDGRANRVRLFIWGWAAGNVLLAVFSDDPVVAGNLWKWGFGMPAALIGALLACRSTAVSRGRLGWLLPIVGVGLMSFRLGARFIAGAAVTSAIAMLVMRAFDGHGRLSTKQLVGGSVVGVAVLLVVLPAYDAAARRGLLGEEALVQFERQSTGLLGVVPGARLELLGAVPAIMDAPLLGHGSSPEDRGGYYIGLIVRHAALAGYDADYYQTLLNSDKGILLIPSHSHITQGWIEAGVLGALPWFWAAYLAAQALLRGNPVRSELTPLIVLVAIVTLMDVFFSPYSGSRLVSTPFYLVLLGTPRWRFADTGASNRVLAAPTPPTGRPL